MSEYFFQNNNDMSMKKRIKLENRGVRANCAHCQFGGIVEDFMCNCSNDVLKLDTKKTIGYRKCAEFKLDANKYDGQIYA